MEPLMVPPSQGWFEVSSDSSGSGSAVGERADRVSERAVGDRAKSTAGQFSRTPEAVPYMTYLDCPAHSMPRPPVARLGRPY
jgi:hypothetical protein